MSATTPTGPSRRTRNSTIDNQVTTNGAEFKMSPLAITSPAVLHDKIFNTVLGVPHPLPEDLGGLLQPRSSLPCQDQHITTGLLTSIQEMAQTSTPSSVSRMFASQLDQRIQSVQLYTGKITCTLRARMIDHHLPFLTFL
jgi:hypothetical protein